MKTKLTLLFVALFNFSIILEAADIQLNNFENGSPTVSTKYGASYLNEVNPSVSGINLSSNCGKIARTSGNWYELIYFPASFSVPANSTKYVHIMVKYHAQPDIAIRVDASSAGGDGSADIRPINKYVNYGQWQDMVFAISGGTSGKTVIQINYLGDMGWNNTPSGLILNNSTNFGYIDEIIVNDDELPRGTVFMTDKNIYNFEGGQSGNITGVSTYSDANNTVTYPVNNPFKTGINTSDNAGKRTASSGTSNWYAGFTFNLTNPILIDENHKYLHTMISVPVAGQKVVFNVIQGGTTKVNDNAGLTTITNANTWQDVVIDLSALQYVSGISIKCGNFNSGLTAAGDYYFDEIYIDGNPSPRTGISTGMNKQEIEEKVYTDNNQIIIENLMTQKEVSIFNLNGLCVFKKIIDGNTEIKMEKSGLYIVKIGDRATKHLVL